MRSGRSFNMPARRQFGSEYVLEWLGGLARGLDGGLELLRRSVERRELGSGGGNLEGAFFPEHGGDAVSRLPALRLA